MSFRVFQVAAFTKMRSGDKYGAYAEYSVRLDRVGLRTIADVVRAGVACGHRVPPGTQDDFRGSASVSSGHTQSSNSLFALTQTPLRFRSPT